MSKSSTDLWFSYGVDEGLSFSGVGVWAAYCLPHVRSRLDLRVVRRRMIEEIVCWPCWCDCEAVDGLVVDFRRSPAFAFVIDRACTRRRRHGLTFKNGEREMKQMHGESPLATRELTARRSRQMALADCQRPAMWLLYFEHQRPTPYLRMKRPLPSASLV